MSYTEFLKRKIKTINDAGFEVNDFTINPNLFDFQKHIVKWALKKGRAAIFADCGLGKTLMQLDWAHQVVNHTNKPVIILCPLAVSGQTIKEGEKFGIEVIRWQMEFNTWNETPAKVYISNYEQLEHLPCEDFAGVVLDESSILKNFEGATKKLVLDSFKNTPYKLACTATPSPNDDMEICNHAEFLNHGTRSEILATYFVHDGGETSKWRLKGHAQDKFWQFISTWAIMINNPCDLGYDGSGYVLPKLNYVQHEIKTQLKEGRLFNDVNISATNFNQELRNTIEARMSKVAHIVNNCNESYIIWIKQDVEGDMLKKLIPDAVEVRGSDSPEKKEANLLGFANNKFRVLITKTKIAQFGLNYQNCHNQIFASLDFSFEGLYQAIRRSYRFGQLHEVNIHIITTDTMQNVLQAIKNKEKQFEVMKHKLSNLIKQAA